MKGTILFFLGALVVVSSGCATTESFSYKTAKTAAKNSHHDMALLKQKQRRQLKAMIRWYREKIVETERDLKFSRALRPRMQAIAQWEDAKEAKKMLKEIDKSIRDDLKILREMRIELQRALELQRRHKHLQ